MSKRFDILPFRYHCPGLSAVEKDESGEWVCCASSHACLDDLQDFEKANPLSTVFDFETYMEGWQAGYEYAMSKENQQPNRRINE